MNTEVKLQVKVHRMQFLELIASAICASSGLFLVH